MDQGKKALLVIDMQNDFMDKGSLSVPGANELIDTINKLMELEWDLIVASQDWHPENHVSFASNNPGMEVNDTLKMEGGFEQHMWPNHCVQGSRGAEFHPNIKSELFDKVVRKGLNRQVDSYSAFRDNSRYAQTELDDLLKASEITEINVVGLAGDFCVYWTALDGKELNYDVNFVMDATRSVFPNPDLGEALREIEVEVIQSKDLI